MRGGERWDYLTPAFVRKNSVQRVERGKKFPRVVFHDTRVSELDSREAEQSSKKRNVFAFFCHSLKSPLCSCNITYSTAFTSFFLHQQEDSIPILVPARRCERFSNKSSEPVIWCWCHRCVFAMATTSTAHQQVKNGGTCLWVGMQGKTEQPISF